MRSITLTVCAIDVPGFVFMLTMTVPVSSSGIRPVLVALTSSTSNTKDTAIELHISHRRWRMNITPRT